MRRRTTGGIALLAAALLVLSACNKSSSSNTTGGAGAFGETKDATIAAELPSSVQSKGSVTVATDASYAPMEFFAPDNTTIEGMDVDLGQALGAVLGIKFNFVNATFNNIIPGLQSGKYDLGFSSFFDTKERQATVDMIDYFQAGSGIFTISGNSNTYTSLDQLCGQAVAAESGTTELSDAEAAAAKCQSEGKPKMTVLSFASQNGVNLAVTSGRALVGLADTEVAEYQTKVTNGKLRFAGNYASAVLYGLAIPRPSGATPGSGPMTKPIFDALNKLFSDGTYTKILSKWSIQSGALSAPTINGSTS